MLTLVVPTDIAFYIGPMRLSVYRILLVLVAVPSLIYLLMGRAGRLQIVDLFVFLFPCWVALALFSNHGIAAWESSGIVFIETVVPYLIARCGVRSVEDLKRLVRLFMLVVSVLVPFAMYESLTGQHVLRSLFGSGYIDAPEPRLGLDRAFGPFEHPILYGVFCASGAGLSLYLLGQRSKLFIAAARYGVIALATFLSLSSGPLVALVWQTGLIIWDGVTRTFRHRWRVLFGFFLLAYVIVDVISNRTPFHVFAAYLTLNPQTAYGRMIIFEHGVQSVANNPMLGIGLNEWERPGWMSTSMDNFWLLIAVRYGLPALALLAGAIVILCTRLGRATMSDAEAARCRNGWMITLIGVAIAGATVHFWNALYVWFMFLIGSGVWMLAHVEKSVPERAARPLESGRARPLAAGAAALRPAAETAGARSPLTPRGAFAPAGRGRATAAFADPARSLPP